MSSRRYRRKFTTHIDSEKVTRFQTGTFSDNSTYSRRQRELERQRQDENDTASVLESFKQSFEPERHDRPKAWVSAGSLNPETGVERGTKRKLYLPPKAVSTSDPPPAKRPALEKKPNRGFSDDKPKSRKMTDKQRARMMKAAKVGSKLVGLSTRRKQKKSRNTIEMLIKENEATKRAQDIARSMASIVHPPNGLRPSVSGVSLPTNKTLGKISPQMIPRESSYRVPQGAKKFEIKIPGDKVVKQTIDRLALHVARDGMIFENLAISRERKNRNFDFLFNIEHSDHLYYRWRTISLCFGDSLQGWREKPFQIILDGAWWIPPKATKAPSRHSRTSSSSSSHDRDRSRGVSGRSGSYRRNGMIPVGARPLSEVERVSFMNTLRQLNRKRHTIREAMAFCLDKSYKCREVVEIISESLTISQTKAEKKLARLYLVSDILHNSQAMVKNASAYRSEFQKRLREIFISVKECYDRQDASTKEGAELKTDFETSVKSVLRVWDRWNLFPTHLVKGLRLIFLPHLKDAAAKEDPAGGDVIGVKNKLEDDKEDVPDILAMALAGKVGGEDEESEVDGEPMDEELDGAPMDDDDDLDGEPL